MREHGRSLHAEQAERARIRPRAGDDVGKGRLPRGGDLDRDRRRIVGDDAQAGANVAGHGPLGAAARRHALQSHAVRGRSDLRRGGRRGGAQRERGKTDERQKTHGGAGPMPQAAAE